MSKAIIVKTNKQTDIQPYSAESNKKPIYEIVKARLPKGNYVISAKAFFYVKNRITTDSLPYGLLISLECNGQNDQVSVVLNPPFNDRCTVPLNMAISLENDAEVHLKVRVTYHAVSVFDAQISAISVDELSISTGHCWNIGDIDGVNFRPFTEENGNPFIQDDMMKLEDNRWLLEFFRERVKRKSTWLGRLVEGIAWLTKK